VRSGAPTHHVSARRFPPPWTIDEHAESFIVKNASWQALGYLYFDDDEPQRRSATNRLTATRPAAWRQTSPSCRSWCGAPLLA
jgi:hypothetical protein